MSTDPSALDQLPTPSLVVERGVFDANVAAMAAAWPGPSLRPHVKAFNDSPFEIAVSVLATVISATHGQWAVADAGLKAFGMDHGPPSWPGGEIAFVSDEHTTLLDPEGTLAVGDRVKLLPGHLDPTVARHQRYWVVDGNDVVDCWPIDLRHW